LSPRSGSEVHGCPKHVTWPKHNAEFWRAKILGNRARDRRQTRLLRAAGWKVLRIWEHALRPKNAMRTLARLRRSLGA
jgi:DNA mismatch endonuclease (patch repair protein)